MTLTAPLEPALPDLSQCEPRSPSPIEHRPISALRSKSSVLLTPVGHSASPSPINIIGITSPRTRTLEPSQAASLDSKSLTPGFESPAISTSFRSLFVIHESESPSAHTQACSPTIYIPPPAPLHKHKRPGHGLILCLRNLPEFSIPASPPLGQSPPVISPRPVCNCSPLKSPFLIRKGKGKGVDRSGYFVKVSV
ncbi:hypothetical protein V5O48_009100 [Marasmius crinis-equi]|uniref:Uncharacterized protein n=1 Tax=Marasmius crinis-equi TaxID=585013 RepID=A0ABR3F7R7_9AGAR